MDKEKRDQEKFKNKPKGSQISGLLPTVSENFFTTKTLLLIGLSLIIAFLITPSFTVTSPSYQLGDVAYQNIKAKRDFIVLNEDATQKRREEAVRLAPAVFDLDELVVQQIQERMDAAFQSMRDHLAEGLQMDGSQDGESESPSASDDTFLSVSPMDLRRVTEHAFQKKGEFEKLLGAQVSDDLFSNLLEKGFSRDLQDRAVHLLLSTFERGILSSKSWLLQAQGKSLVVRRAASQDEVLVQPPHPYQDLEDARNLVRMQALEQSRDNGEMRVAAFLVAQILQPNLTFNIEETERRREQAYASVKPVYLQLVRNEMLVREGQRIGPEELLKLRYHQLGGSSRHWLLIFISVFLFVGLSMWVVVNVTRQHIPAFRMDLPDFLFLGLIIVFLLTLGRSTLWMAENIGETSVAFSGATLIYAIPLSAGAMMASILFGVTASLIFSLLLTIFAGMLFGKDFGLFLYFLIGSFVAAHGVTPCRNRMTPIRAGLLVGCANVILILLGALLQDQLLILRTLTNAFFGLCGGVFAGILVTGFTPLAEMAFGYTTDIKLLELVTMDQPLLQELMVQAPGTYHHSVIVGNMVEAAAKSIGANSLLAKVAAYYHDIGKIKKPLYFIENQFDCENRHEKLAPSMSSLILIKHVKEGVELAKQHRLGRDIIDIIRQHHGTSFISFFYKKALEAREKAQSSKAAPLPPIDMDDYRYPGPKPQTKEAGLVMLADVVEAACRSLTEPTPARIQGMVNRLINNIFSDGQLEACELTLKDLNHIAKHFNQILATVHHKRIEYPTVPAPALNGKAKSDAPDSSQRESKADRDKPAANRESGRADLKRLGIH